MSQYVVVVERGKKSVTVGPYNHFKYADLDANKWDNTDGRKAWVEVIVPREAYTKQHTYEVAEENRENI